MPSEPIRPTLIRRTLRRVKQLPRVRALRYWYAVHFGHRDYYSFTQFLRLPTQYEALTGPVLDHLGDTVVSGPLRIVVIGCSTGAEPYSIAAVLLKRHPQLTFHVEAYDIGDSLLAKARQREYTVKEVTANSLIPPSFLADIFEEIPGGYLVRTCVAERVSFHHGDVLDADFPGKAGLADIVYAQNILFNLPRSHARRALANISRILKPRAALFLDGTDLDMRKHFARVQGLQPLNFEVRRIHDEARMVRGPRWPYSYTGLEPFNDKRKDCRAYYATVFLK